MDDKIKSSDPLRNVQTLDIRSYKDDVPTHLASTGR
jgi:hypothetical protein